jgi:hypothetical protein
MDSITTVWQIDADRYKGQTTIDYLGEIRRNILLVLEYLINDMKILVSSR